jgi:hypothetical protein
MKRYRMFLLMLTVVGTLSVPLFSAAQSAQKIQVIYMGGDDCPPCVAWRQFELPKLQATEVFQRIEFVHVQKVIASTVPSRFFLPSSVKPLKDKLDTAANGMTGSPQMAILVDGEVYDYFFGTRSAAQLESALLAIENGQAYPASRCLRWKSRRNCEIRG